MGLLSETLTMFKYVGTGTTKGDAIAFSFLDAGTFVLGTDIDEGCLEKFVKLTQYLFKLRRPRTICFGDPP